MTKTVLSVDPYRLTAQVYFEEVVTLEQSEGQEETVADCFEEVVTLEAVPTNLEEAGFTTEEQFETDTPSTEGKTILEASRGGTLDQTGRAAKAQQAQ